MNKFNKTKIAESFSRAASSYDAVAVLQREVGSRLLKRLDLIRLSSAKTILDIGCGTGVITRELEKLFPKATILAADLAHGMLVHAKHKKKWLSKQQFICSDIEQLPLPDNSIDFIYSNMMLHWCNNLDQAFAELNRILKPDGLFLFSTLGPDTLQELRYSWSQVDDKPHVNIFIDMHDIGDGLMRAKFKDPVMDVENFTLTYADVLPLMHDLKSLGAHNVIENRHTGLTGKQTLKKLIQTYETLRNPAGLLPATYEVVYGHAWGNEIQQENEVKIPLTKIGKIIK